MCSSGIGHRLFSPSSRAGSANNYYYRKAWLMENQQRVTSCTCQVPFRRPPRSSTDRYRCTTAKCQSAIEFDLFGLLSTARLLSIHLSMSICRYSIAITARCKRCSRSKIPCNRLQKKTDIILIKLIEPTAAKMAIASIRPWHDLVYSMYLTRKEVQVPV